jgi:hypothetical protein
MAGSVRFALGRAIRSLDLVQEIVKVPWLLGEMLKRGRISD